MVINNGGNLSKDYFLAYISLITNAKQCSVDQAKEILFKRLFNVNKKTLGPISYNNFISAYTELKSIESKDEELNML
ncbi:hypothetical protein [Heyndrickxia oleronia]|uniref:Uncharacterized protein n=1 Tax=Heyndrickxia oleronia TaxID=38875 RepID=A0AAW6T1G1_9BACI|nr:hypothetical protein [Heyndrickxia oleronia]MDH5163412.1 hypothetical protein [Heyndrickxia oleronia]